MLYLGEMAEREAKSPQDTLYHRVVVKLGTNLLTGGGGHLDLEVMASLVRQVAKLHRQGLEIAFVSSGAIALGRYKIGLTKERKDISTRQVLASVGQSKLMYIYEQLFDQHGITVAQALLTKLDIASRIGYLNARNTLLALLELRVVPIINENDVVATNEIEEANFGDNDNLSAMVANLIDADLLILLSDVGGLYTSDPHLDPDAQLISQVERIDGHIEHLARGSMNYQGTGGMITKIEAAKLATRSGVTVAIAEGKEPEVILRLIRGESIGTLFSPTATKLESRKRWMLSGLACRGRLIVDDGTIVALKERNRSLLPVGIMEVEGKFQRGDIVDIFDCRENRLARGISNYSSADITVIKGSHSDRILPLLGYEYGTEVVHRNNLILL